MPKKQTMTEAQSNHIAATILGARSAAGISQRELSRRLNVTQPLISAWEQGKSVPSLTHIVAIESALDITKTELLYAIAYGGDTNN
jgi:hypothetical protein